MVPGAVDTPNPTLSERWSDVGHQATVTIADCMLVLKGKKEAAAAAREFEAKLAALDPWVAEELARVSPAVHAAGAPAAGAR